MAENTVTYYIGFFKYDDTTIWQKTNLYKEADYEKLKEHLNNLLYCDKKTITIQKIQLPD